MHPLIPTPNLHREKIWGVGCHGLPPLPPTLIFMVLGASAVISFCMRSAMPGYMVVPPDNTLLA